MDETCRDSEREVAERLEKWAGGQADRAPVGCRIGFWSNRQSTIVIQASKERQEPEGMAPLK
jgi:hypothetical protein